MTLAEVLPAIRQLSVSEKLKLLQILAEDLDTAQEILPLEPFKTYDLPTPYDNFGAGLVLVDSKRIMNQPEKTGAIFKITPAKV